MNAPALTDVLTDSLEPLAAIERIDIVECHTLPHGTYAVTGELLPTHCCRGAHEDDHPPCVEVYALEVPLDSVSREVVYARTAEDAACELLIRCTDDADQSPRSVRWATSMIERRFARARERAMGGA